MSFTFIFSLLVHLALLTGACTGVNLYRRHAMFVNPRISQQIRRTAATSNARDRVLLRPLANVPTAVWLSSKATVNPSQPGNIRTARAVLARAAKQRRQRRGRRPVVTFVVYNLPNRDCGARASAGQICCGRRRRNGQCDYTASPRCTRGLTEYRSSYINVLARTVRQYCRRVLMSFIIEPDSLPNLITNLGNPRCGSRATRTAYRTGVRYAVATLSAACRDAAIYVDAAHGGWLGWNANAAGFAQLVAQLRIWRRVRGFAVNVSNYQQLGRRCPAVGICNGGGRRSHPCCRFDACGLARSGNEGFSALAYVGQLQMLMRRRMPRFRPRFVVDTARNGGRGGAASCANWCNVRSAGVGVRPTATLSAARGGGVVDALLWVKPPTESDGCTRHLPSGGGTCRNFDAACASSDSVGSRRGEPRAPNAGVWFPALARSLARNGQRA